MSYQNIFVNKYVPDNNLPINPIKTNTRKLNIHFDTLFRENSNQLSSDFTYKLPDPINDILSLRLSSIDIPSSWYTISENNNNNTFIINTIKNTNPTVSHIITIPEGNYSSDELVDFINNNYLNASNPSNDLKYIQVSNNPNSLKTLFEVTNPPANFRFEVIFNIQNELGNVNIFNIGWLLGFRNNTYSNIIYSIESEGLLDVGGNRYIYISLEDYQSNKSNHHLVYFQNNSINDSILAKIYLYNGRFSLNIIEDDPINNTKLRNYFGPIKLSKFHIKLLDKYGNIINLNNMDYSFSLELEILYNGNNKL